jgi:DMSO/TMAO reductase YedYZ molybdopterin-dependent catalytic subunit
MSVTASSEGAVERASETEGVTFEELQLAARNHGMPLEGLRYDVTPVGMHYLLTHFDIPFVDPADWALSVDGLVHNELSLSLDDVRARPSTTIPVTMECAGNGRARLRPRPISQPWLQEAVGTAEWTGTPLGPVLDEAGLRDDARELVFTGLDRGVQGEVEQDYQRSLIVAEARRPEVLLVYEINGMPLPPQHGFPLRLIVPGWYGMTQVKWLARITAVAEPFAGFQQAVKYHERATEDDPGRPVTRIQPRSLMVPPGMPEFLSRDRLVPLGRCTLRGRAWSGWAPVARVEVSADGGRRWADAALGTPPGPFAWTPWTFDWEPGAPGGYVLCSRATDGAGTVQPTEQVWNVEGVSNTMVQRVNVQVTPPANA